MNVQHKFVEFIPEELEEGVVYISLHYCTAIHKCVCGCGNEVVTPISPGDWRLTFDGKTISLYPSIGNWNFKCKSHYWITNSKVRLASKWLDYETSKRDKKNKQKKEIVFQNLVWFLKK